MNKQQHTITIELTVECGDSFDLGEINHELFQRHGSLKYVWNNCRTLYGSSGVVIVAIEAVEPK